MKRIKFATEELEKEAHRNAEGYDHSELCFKSIFHLLDDNGVFYNAINEILKSKQPCDLEIRLKDIKYGIVRENDNKLYPVVDLIITVTDSEVSDFVFSVTPFNAMMETVELWDAWNGNCDEQLTQVWQTIMKGVFKEKWLEAFERYCLNKEKVQACKTENLTDTKCYEIKSDEEECVETF